MSGLFWAFLLKLHSLSFLALKRAGIRLSPLFPLLHKCTIPDLHSTRVIVCMITAAPCALTFLMMLHVSFSGDVGYDNQIPDRGCYLLITLSLKRFCCIGSALCSHVDFEIVIPCWGTFFFFLQVGTVSFVQAQVGKSPKALLLLLIPSFILLARLITHFSSVEAYGFQML